MGAGQSWLLLACMAAKSLAGTEERDVAASMLLTWLEAQWPGLSPALEFQIDGSGADLHAWLLKRLHASAGVHAWVTAAMEAGVAHLHQAGLPLQRRPPSLQLLSAVMTVIGCCVAFLSC